MWDESGFSLSPNRRRTWAPVGQTPTITEAPRCRSQTGLGFLTITPERRLVDFRFTMTPEGLKTPECIFWLREIHLYYRKKVIMVWDNLSVHYATEAYFTEERPDWFDFYYFPSYSPELNPVVAIGGEYQRRQTTARLLLPTRRTLAMIRFYS